MGSPATTNANRKMLEIFYDYDYSSCRELFDPWNRLGSLSTRFTLDALAPFLCTMFKTGFFSLEWYARSHFVTTTPSIYFRHFSLVLCVQRFCHAILVALF